jgi:hypothetical protein
MKLTKQVRGYIGLAVKELDEAGIPWEVEAGGKHFRLVYFVDGREFGMIVSNSPSDNRSALNFRSQVRKTIRAKMVQ